VCLGWHLATQVLYAVAAVMILFTEIMARVQICCNPQRKTRYLASIGIIVIVSGNSPISSSSCGDFVATDFQFS